MKTVVPYNTKSSELPGVFWSDLNVVMYSQTLNKPQQTLKQYYKALIRSPLFTHCIVLQNMLVNFITYISENTELHSSQFEMI